MPYYLAIDAGGTKTDYALADDSRILARVRAGTIKRIRVDASTAEANLDFALRELSDASRTGLLSVTRTCVGAAGSSLPMVSSWIRENLGRRVGGEIVLVEDIEIALNAAFPGTPGVLLLAGTGSNAAGRSQEGKFITAGGWGPILGDQGSGYSIGLQALRNLCVALDQGRQSVLLKKVLALWELDSLPGLIECAHAIPTPDFATLTRLIVESANEGDDVAVETLKQAAADLAQLGASLIRKMTRFSQTNLEQEIKVAFAGSVLGLEAVRTQTMSLLRVMHPQVTFLSSTPDPIEGALWRAKQPTTIDGECERNNEA